MRCVSGGAGYGAGKGGDLSWIDVTAVEKRTRVLLVEDEPQICDIATEALEEQGFEVEAVSNAGEALRRLTSGLPVDILFTDVNLHGGMDGAALARLARELRPGLPVIYTSGGQAVIESIDPGRRVDVRGQAVRPFPHRPAARLSGGGQADIGSARGRRQGLRREHHPSFPPRVRKSASQWMW